MTVVMGILVTSASGANGNGYGAILSFGPDGEFTGPFSTDLRSPTREACPWIRAARLPT